MRQNTTCMRENKKFPRRVQCSIFTKYAPPAKTKFSHNYQANTWWDPLFRSLVLCSFLKDSSALGKISGSELLNWILDDSSHSKIFQNMQGGFSSTSSASSCLQDSFLSFPENDPTKYAWLSLSPHHGPLLENVSNHSFLFQMLNQ